MSQRGRYNNRVYATCVSEEILEGLVKRIETLEAENKRRNNKNTMTPETRTFNLTEQQLTEGRAKLSNDFAFHLVTDSGTIDKDGCKGRYDIAHNVNDVEGQASVTITITSLPVFVNSAFAWARIAGTFNDVKKAFPAPVTPVDKMATGTTSAIE